MKQLNGGPGHAVLHDREKKYTMQENNITGGKKMNLSFKSAVLILCSIIIIPLLNCKVERNNQYDPKADNYIGNLIIGTPTCSNACQIMSTLMPYEEQCAFLNYENDCGLSPESFKSVCETMCTDNPPDQANLQCIADSFNWDDLKICLGLTIDGAWRQLTGYDYDEDQQIAVDYPRGETYSCGITQVDYNNAGDILVFDEGQGKIREYSDIDSINAHSCQSFPVDPGIYYCPPECGTCGENFDGYEFDLEFSETQFTISGGSEQMTLYYRIVDSGNTLQISEDGFIDHIEEYERITDWDSNNTYSFCPPGTVGNTTVLNDGGSIDAGDPGIEIAVNGARAIVAWHEVYSGNNKHVYTNMYDINNNQWSGMQQLDGANEGNDASAFNPGVAVEHYNNDSIEAGIIWAETDEQTYSGAEINVRFYNTANNSWESGTAIGRSKTVFVKNPSIDMNWGGYAVAAWVDNADSARLLTNIIDPQIQSVGWLYNYNDSWFDEDATGDLMIPNDVYTTEGIDDHDVALGWQGQGSDAWVAYISGDDLHMANYDLDTTQGWEDTPEKIFTGAVPGEQDMAIALNRNTQDLFAAWTTNDGLQASYFDFENSDPSSDGWSAPIDIVVNANTGNCGGGIHWVRIAQSPALNGGAPVNIAIVFYNCELQNIYAAVYTEGTAWESNSWQWAFNEEALNDRFSDSNVDWYSFDIAMDRNGNAAAAWSQVPPGDGAHEIYVSYYETSSNTWYEPKLVFDNGANVKVGMNDENVLVVWESVEALYGSVITHDELKQ